MRSAAVPMHLIVCASPAADSFDQAIVQAYCEAVGRHGQTTEVRDLYRIGFDPVLRAEERPGHAERDLSEDVARELNYVRSADVIVLVYPIWFGLPPAIIKGYVDRVLGSGFSFHDLQGRAGHPLLAGKPLVSFSTSGLALSWLSDQRQVLSLREIFDVYLWRGFGMKRSEHIMIDNVVSNMSSAYARTQLERVAAAADRTCALLADAMLEAAYEA